MATGRPYRVMARPYPFAPLVKAIGSKTPAETAERLGITRRNVYTYAAAGLTERLADRFAIRAGLHPAIVWPEWGEA